MQSGSCTCVLLATFSTLCLPRVGFPFTNLLVLSAASVPVSPAHLLARRIVPLTSSVSITLETWQAFQEAGIVPCLLMEGSKESHQSSKFWLLKVTQAVCVHTLCSKGRRVIWLKPVLG